MPLPLCHLPMPESTACREHQDAYEFFTRLQDAVDEHLRSVRRPRAIHAALGGMFAQARRAGGRAGGRVACCHWRPGGLPFGAEGEAARSHFSRQRQWTGCLMPLFKFFDFSCADHHRD